MGRMGASALCIFIRPLILGTEGFRFTNCHRFSLGMRLVDSLIAFLIYFCNLSVMSFVIGRKLSVIKLFTFLL